MELHELKRRVEALPQIVDFAAEPKLAAMVAAVGMQREVGTVNDELARFVFDADSGGTVPLASLRAELVTRSGIVGVKIWSTACARLEVRLPGIGDIAHPELSRNGDGTFGALYVFPEIIAKLAEMRGVRLTLVRSWALNSVFGNFDPSKGYYQTNFWELENNDTMLFADLVANGRLALLGTHDLVAHVCGLRAEAWPRVMSRAQRVMRTLTSYFAAAPQPTITSLVLPYTVGVVLDDLAQPPSYDSASHDVVLDELLAAVERRAVAPDLRTVLMTFPASFERVIELSRAKDLEHVRSHAAAVVGMLVKETLAHAVGVRVGQ